jgi:ABC-type amino acid transport substrate-binding protein
MAATASTLLLLWASLGPLLALGGHVATTPASSIAAVNEVVIYTKSAAPFSMPFGAKDATNNKYPSCNIGATDDCPVRREAKGLTIDYIVGSAGLLSQINSTVRWERIATVVMLDGVDDSTGAQIGGNPEVFDHIQSAHCDPSVHPQRLCIGAAAISITAERESFMEFLPSYYSSGLRILTKSKTDMMDIAADLLTVAAKVLGSLAVFLLSLIVIVAPLVWICETMGNGADVSIFHATNPSMMRMDDSALSSNEMQITGTTHSIFASHHTAVAMWPRIYIINNIIYYYNIIIL